MVIIQLILVGWLDNMEKLSDAIPLTSGLGA